MSEREVCMIIYVRTCISLCVYVNDCVYMYVTGCVQVRKYIKHISPKVAFSIISKTD